MQRILRIIFGVAIVGLVLHAADLATRDCRIAPYVYDDCMWIGLRAHLGLPASRFLRMAVLECVGIILALVLYLTFRHVFAFAERRPPRQIPTSARSRAAGGIGLPARQESLTPPCGYCCFPRDLTVPSFRSTIENGIFMSWVASVGEREYGGRRRGLFAIATALEVAVIFAGILAYIWRWQHTSPRAWMALLALILVSHVVHHDTLRGLGLRGTGLRASAQWCCRWPSSCTCRCYSMDFYATAWRFCNRPGNLFFPCSAMAVGVCFSNT